MKATLEFSLPDDKSAMLLAAHAGQILACLHDADQELRTLLKHGPPLPEEATRVLTGIRELLGEAQHYAEYE